MYHWRRSPTKFSGDRFSRFRDEYRPNGLIETLYITDGDLSYSKTD